MDTQEIIKKEILRLEADRKMNLGKFLANLNLRVKAEMSAIKISQFKLSTSYINWYKFRSEVQGKVVSAEVRDFDPKPNGKSKLGWISIDKMKIVKISLTTNNKKNYAYIAPCHYALNRPGGWSQFIVLVGEMFEKKVCVAFSEIGMIQPSISYLNVDFIAKRLVQHLS